VAFEGTVMVRAEVPPLAEMEVGERPRPKPAGPPEADKATVDEKPFKKLTVIVEPPLLPCNTETEAGEAETVKVGVVDAPTRALISPAPFMLPQPVTRS